MDKKEGGVWRTINGSKVFIEDGQTLEEALADRKKAGELLGYETEPKRKPAKLTKRHEKALGLAKSDNLPKGVKPVEYLGGTMDADGNSVDMRKFRSGYLVSCGNDSMPGNREFLHSPEGRAFLERFLSYSSDGELYVGSWYENGKNNNEPTIWIEDKETAMKLAKALGQYQITDCAAYNEFGCENYNLLNEDQLAAYDKIFLTVCGDAEHRMDLRKANI